MSSLRYSCRCLRDIRPATKPQWPTFSKSLVYRPKRCADSSRLLSTTASRHQIPNNEITREPPRGNLDGIPGQWADSLVPESSEAPGQRHEGIAMVDGEFEYYSEDPNDTEELQLFARPMPASPSYFSRTPVFNDAFIIVQDLARKYWRLPILPKDQVTPTAWKTKEQYRLATGEHMKGRDYSTCMKLAKRLNQIHPDLMPEDVKAGLQPFKRDINYHLNKPKPIPIDKFGRALGTGKRKSSIAQAWLVEGTGEVLVNGKPLSEAFGRIHDRESALWALKSTQRMDKYNVWALVRGGGTTGQAEAMTLAVAKALCAHEPALKTPLRKAGCITRDHRVVERKKHGHVKARKMPTWVKR